MLRVSCLSLLETGTKHGGFWLKCRQFWTSYCYSYERKLDIWF